MCIDRDTMNTYEKFSVDGLKFRYVKGISKERA